MFTSGVHTDADHVQEFQNRWDYVNGVYGRPNFVTFSENKGRYFNGIWLPEGSEGEEFIFVSDHNRGAAQFTPDRIGARKRMINGQLRSYHVADKFSLPLNWDNLPSRAYSDRTGYSAYILDPNGIAKFTVDGGAGGLELLDWHNRHQGSFWAFFSYDATRADIGNTAIYQGYSMIREVIITDFEYEIVGRSPGALAGNNRYFVDMWNLSMTLEEV
jgi:hypothetical protein